MLKWAYEVSDTEDGLRILVDRMWPRGVSRRNAKHVRFNSDEGIENVVSLSELRSMDFGRDYGLRMTDGTMAGLLARAIVIADKQGKVVYTQLVPEVTEEPDYDNALSHLEGLKTGSGQAAGGTAVSYDAEVCAKAPEFSEHHRFSDDDDACDDGRSGRI